MKHKQPNISKLLPRAYGSGLLNSENGHLVYTVFFPEFGKFDTTVTSAITALWLSRMLYWNGKGTIAKGWVRKSSNEWKTEILCTYSQLGKIVENLEKQRLIEKRLGRGKIPEYRVFWDRVDDALMSAENGEILGEVREPRKGNQRQFVSHILKGSNKYEAYRKSYSCKAYSDGQVESRANKLFDQFKPFIILAKQNPAEYTPKLNGTYKKTKVSGQKVLELELKPPAPTKPKKKKTVTNTSKLNAYTDDYLKVFSKKHEKYLKKVGQKYTRPDYISNPKANGKHRQGIRYLVEWLQDRMISKPVLNPDTNKKEIYEKHVDIPISLVKHRLGTFLDIAATVSDKDFYLKRFTPADINSQKDAIESEMLVKHRAKSKSQNIITAPTTADAAAYSGVEFS